MKSLAVQDISVRQPDHIGGHVVFRAKSVSLHPSWAMLRGEPHSAPRHALATASMAWE